MPEPLRYGDLKPSLSEHTALRAQQDILACESCAPDTAEIPFTWLLDDVSGQDPSITDYLLSEPVVYPRCRAEVYEETLVEG